MTNVMAVRRLLQRAGILVVETICLPIFDAASIFLAGKITPSTVGARQFLPIMEGALAQQVVGAGGYAYWNRTIYAELSLYSTAGGIWSFMSKGNKAGNLNHPQTYLRGQNAYWRLALPRDWGRHSVMLGTFGINVHVYPNDVNAFPVFTRGVTRYRDVGFDAQYQYLLGPHTITTQARYIRENISDPKNLGYGDSKADSVASVRLKLSYICEARYGISLSFFNVTGSRDSVAYPGSANFPPATQGWTPEIFWIPVQNIPDRSAIHLPHQISGCAFELRWARTQCKQQRHAASVPLGGLLVMSRAESERG